MMTTLTVTNNSDSGDGSLRAELAIASRSSGDTIDFAPNIGTIQILSTLNINANVTIEGSGTATSSKVVIDGGGNVTDFTVNGGNVVIDGLTIQNGHGTGTYDPHGFAPPSAAGGIYDSGYSVLSVTNSIITGDSSVGAQGENGDDYQPFGSIPGMTGGSAAGGIYVDVNAKLNIIGANTFANNSAIGGAGGTGGTSPPFAVTPVYVPPRAGGAGGAGGIAISPSVGTGGGDGGSPGLQGSPGAPPVATPITLMGQPVYAPGSGAGGNGGTAYGDYGGEGIIDVEASACFATGTAIRTVLGDVSVEDLKVGDIVVTTSGTERAIRWLGHRTIDCRNLRNRAHVLPVRVEALAFGPAAPARDLFVSPGHAICVDVIGEVLVPAGALVNGTTITQVQVEAVTYWHVELDSHDVILAEGLPAESYIEMGNRSFFAACDLVVLHTAPDASVVTHADFCRPFVDGGPLLEALKARLKETSGKARCRARKTSRSGQR